MDTIGEALTQITKIRADMNSELTDNLVWLKENRDYFVNLNHWMNEFIYLPHIASDYRAETIANIENTIQRTLEVCDTLKDSFDSLINAQISNRRVDINRKGDLYANLTLTINLLKKLTVALADTKIFGDGTLAEAIPDQLSTKINIDFVIVTALPEERDAVLKRLPGSRKLPPSPNHIRIYYQSQLPVTYSDGSSSSYNVIVTMPLGKGRVQAAMATADAIRHWNPRYVLLIGIAGGCAGKVALGDLLIANQIVDYELQKITEQGPQVRWEVYRASSRLLTACNEFSEENWLGEVDAARPVIGKCQRYVGSVASGDKVIAFEEVLEKYQNVWPELIGVEMEASGVAAAADQGSGHIDFFMVRCVSDLADVKKGTVEADQWRPYACEVAATFGIAFLKSGPVDNRTGRE